MWRIATHMLPFGSVSQLSGDFLNFQHLFSDRSTCASLYSPNSWKRSQDVGVDPLSWTLSGLYNRGDGGSYTPLGPTEGGRWLEQQIQRADAVDLVLDTIPSTTDERSSGRDSYRLLQEASWRGTAFRRFLHLRLDEFLKIRGSPAKAALHAVRALIHFPNVQIYALPEQAQTEAQLSVRTESESFAPRWPHGLNPFVEARETDFSTGPQTINAVLARFDDWVNRSTAEPWAPIDWNPYFREPKLY